MKVGIIRFPGATCEFDTFKYFKDFGHDPFFIYHKETECPTMNLLVLPGGYSFGDREYQEATGKYIMNPGKQAINSPVMSSIIRRAADFSIPILGICNGFQILVQAGLLPGKLKRNSSRKFYCDHAECQILGRSFFRDGIIAGLKIDIPVAHGYGRYELDHNDYQHLMKNGQIFLQYSYPVNGSDFNIAGVCNDAGTVFGMMPHPERSPKREVFMRAMEKYVKKYNN